MDNASYFIDDKAIFGSFPTQDDVTYLETTHNVRLFVDLTSGTEHKTTPYTTQYKYIRYPISDSGTPNDIMSFAKLVIYISDYIKSVPPNHTVYVHCKGGHGRSGVVVACILCYYFNICPAEALQKTNASHGKRLVMRERWRTIGSPQTYAQKRFVIQFFSPQLFYPYSKSIRTFGFSNFAKLPVKTQQGLFPTAESAIQAMKNPNDKEYVLKQQQSRTPFQSRSIGQTANLRADWNDVKEIISFEIIKTKFDQYPELKQRLLQTGLRKLVFRNKDDLFWGDGGTGLGENKMGKMLCALRDIYVREDISKKPV